MINPDVKQAIVVTGPWNPAQPSERLALFEEDGTPVDISAGGEGATKFQIVVPCAFNAQATSGLGNDVWGIPVGKYSVFDKSKYEGYSSIRFGAMMNNGNPEHIGEVTVRIVVGVDGVTTLASSELFTDEATSDESTDEPAAWMESADISDDLPDELIYWRTVIKLDDIDNTWGSCMSMAIIVRYGE